MGKYWLTALTYVLTVVISYTIVGKACGTVQPWPVAAVQSSACGCGNVVSAVSLTSTLNQPVFF